MPAPCSQLCCGGESVIDTSDDVAPWMSGLIIAELATVQVGDPRHEAPGSSHHPNRTDAIYLRVVHVS